MLGLAVLFFLGVWVVITIVAMVIGWKFTQKRWGIKAGLLGAFLGFMLTMGGFIIYWTIEYYQIQRTVTKLCETEGGIKVYVTPEEWRKQIGEEEWLKLYPYSWEEQSKYPKEKIIFKGREYNSSGQYNERLVVYATYKKIAPYILSDYFLYYDIKEKIPLFSVNSFNVGTGSIPDELKFWINNIQSCDNTSKQSNILNQYRKKGEKNEQ